MQPKTRKPKIDGSDIINDLLNAQQHVSGKNWLISYLDVFVLVVMLMVTLVSLSEFKKQTKKHEQTAAKIAEVIPGPVSKTPKPVAREPKKPTVAPSESNAATPVIAAAKPLAIPLITAPSGADSTAKTPDPTLTPVIPPPVDNPQLLEQRLQTELNEKIKRLGLEQSVHMTVNQGYAQLEIQDEVLFQSSEAELTPSGKALLTHLIPMLKESVGLIMIEGHTDNRPINTKRFPSNWELGASRATSVLHFLISERLDSERLRATSYADTKPIADNATPEGREKNRRVNIVIKVENQPR